MNFFIVGTVQAIFFTTFYIGGNMAILGINPIKIIRENRTILGGSSEDMMSTDEKDIEKAV